MVGNGASSYKIDKIVIFKEILNPKGHQNCIIGSAVTMILLNGLIFPIGQSGEASHWRVCYQRGLHRLVSIYFDGDRISGLVDKESEFPQLYSRKANIKMIL